MSQKGAEGETSGGKTMAIGIRIQLTSDYLKIQIYCMSDSHDSRVTDSQMTYAWI